MTAAQLNPSAPMESTATSATTASSKKEPKAKPPCRYFNQPSGCTNANCPFPHVLKPNVDKSKAKASSSSAKIEAKSQSIEANDMAIKPKKRGRKSKKEKVAAEKILSEQGTNAQELREDESKEAKGAKVGAIKEGKNCKYGVNCRNKKCKFVHPVKDGENAKIADAGIGKKSASTSSKGDSETSSSIDETKKKSLEATPSQGEEAMKIKPAAKKKSVKKCRYGAECRNKTCKFLHPEKKGDDNDKSVGEPSTKAATKPVPDTKPSRNEKSSKIQAPKQTEKRKLSNSTGRKGKSIPQDEKEKLSSATQNMRRANMNESNVDKNEQQRDISQGVERFENKAQVPDSNMDQLLFGEGSNEFWNSISGFDQRGPQYHNMAQQMLQQQQSRQNQHMRPQMMFPPQQQEINYPTQFDPVDLMRQERARAERAQQQEIENIKRMQQRLMVQGVEEERERADLAFAKEEAAKKAAEQREREANEKARIEAEEKARVEKARRVAAKKAQILAEEQARAEKLKKEAEERARIVALEKKRAEEKAKLEKKAKLEAEAKARAEEAKRVEDMRKEKERKAQELLKAKEKLEDGRKQAKLEQERRDKAYAEEQALKAQKRKEEEAARLLLFQQQQEAARLKKEKDKAAKREKARQALEARTKVWIDDQNDRTEFGFVAKEFLTAEAVRKSGLASRRELDGQLVRKIQDETARLYNTLYAEKASKTAKVKIVWPQKKDLHNRLGSILSFNSTKKMYEVGLETKNKKVEMQYVAAENLEAQKQTSHSVKSSEELVVTTTYGDLSVTKITIDSLRKIYSSDAKDLKIAIEKRMKDRNAFEKKERLRKEREEQERLKAEEERKKRLELQREQERLRQAREDAEWAREREERRRWAEEERKERKRAARRDPFGFGGPFGMGGPFGGGPFGGGPFGGPKIGVRIGPHGVSFVFMDANGFEEEEYFNFESGYDSDDGFEDDGLSREEHCEILGVDVDATSREIKTAYRRMALKYHPDKFNEESTDTGMSKAEAEEHFKKCSSAYQALSEEFEDE
ncbi:hypothetical protein CTEN210_08434 [Chaetoceros tenuissimus]|uniref:J domain-containing protein n=1 Tax=Chaetoceros tenuissimus TaxID=426638 RepID=A0AAD3CU10_9STRA|nr:hypothetical protein CTEN210_08434 [Chaetoceros tenuissimus]